MTGRVPEYGFHLDRHRRGTILVELKTDLEDLAEWGALGKLVGEPHQSYFEVPVFTGIKRAPTADQLKHLGASLASYGSMAMYHMVGVTPEAPTLRVITSYSIHYTKLYEEREIGLRSCVVVETPGRVAAPPA